MINVHEKFHLNYNNKMSINSFLYTKYYYLLKYVLVHIYGYNLLNTSSCFRCNEMECWTNIHTCQRNKRACQFEYSVCWLLFQRISSKIDRSISRCIQYSYTKVFILKCDQEWTLNDGMVESWRAYSRTNYRLTWFIHVVYHLMDIII